MIAPTISHKLLLHLREPGLWLISSVLVLRVFQCPRGLTPQHGMDLMALSFPRHCLLPSPLASLTLLSYGERSGATAGCWFRNEEIESWGLSWCSCLIASPGRRVGAGREVGEGRKAINIIIILVTHLCRKTWQIASTSVISLESILTSFLSHFLPLTFQIYVINYVINIISSLRLYASKIFGSSPHCHADDSQACVSSLSLTL